MDTTALHHPGQNRRLAIMDAGSSYGRPVGYIDVMVLNAGEYEADVILRPDQGNVEEARCLLDEVGLDLDELREGPVYVLRNMNVEWLT